MKDAKREYEAALADFSQPGNRWMAKGRLTYWGKAAGLTAEQIISDARAAGVADRDADIRRGWSDAKPQGDRPTDRQRFIPRARPKPPPTFPRYVRDLIAAGEREATSADFLAMSPFAAPTDGRAQTAAFLRSLFDPADVLHVFRDDVATAGKPGVNLLPCRDWLAKIERGEQLRGDLVVVNVFTGEEGETTDGKNPLSRNHALHASRSCWLSSTKCPLPTNANFGVDFSRPRRLRRRLRQSPFRAANRFTASCTSDAGR